MFMRDQVLYIVNYQEKHMRQCSKETVTMLKIYLQLLKG